MSFRPHKCADGRVTYRFQFEVAGQRYYGHLGNCTQAEATARVNMLRDLARMGANLDGVISQAKDKQKAFEWVKDNYPQLGKLLSAVGRRINPRRF